jgi:hypothetical protein
MEFPTIPLHRTRLQRALVSGFVGQYSHPLTEKHSLTNIHNVYTIEPRDSLGTKQSESST